MEMEMESSYDDYSEESMMMMRIPSFSQHFPIVGKFCLQ